MKTKEFNIGDRVYKFVNGVYMGGAHKVVEVDEKGFGIIPTDCTINGVVPTIENTKPERYSLDGVEFLTNVGRLSIQKATEELTKKVEKYNTRMLLVDKICEELKIGDRNRKHTSEVLLTRSTKQLFAILLTMIRKADGKHGVCNIDADGKLVHDFFIEEELINEVREES